MTGRIRAGRFARALCAAGTFVALTQCADDRASAPLAAAPEAPAETAAPSSQHEPTPAAAPSQRVPFDISRVVRQVHFAFRPSAGGWEGQHETYTVHASPDSFAITPARRDAGRVVEGAPIRFATGAITRGASVVAAASDGGEVAEDGHLVVHRGAATESLRNGDEGVEQSWRFATEPAGEGDLEVRVDVGNATYAGESAAGLHFVDDATGLGLRYGRATWVDARGERVELSPRWDGHAITLRVPASALARASYPAVLDPTIGPEFGMDAPIPIGNPLQQTAPRLAPGGAGWLVVWQDGRSADEGIWGTRVALDGTVLDRWGIPIATRSTTFVAPSVAFNGTSWLVAWEDDASATDRNVRAARVSAAGVVLDATPIAIATSTYDEQLPAVSSDGSQWFVVWQARATATDRYNIRGSILNGAGALAASVGVTTGDVDHTNPALAFNGTEWLVVWKQGGTGAVTTGTRVSTAGAVSNAWGDALSPVTTTQDNPTVASNGSQWFVAWEESHSATQRDVRGTRVGPTGAVLDSTGILVSAATGDQSNPSASWDGTNWLLTWSDYRADTYGDIYGARVSPAGGVIEASGFAICTQPQFQGNPAVAYNGAQGLVVWADNRFASYRDVYGARLNNAGGVVDAQSFVLSTSANYQSSPSLAFDGTNWLVVWTDLRHDLEYDLYGARVSRSGSVLDPSGIAISTATGRQDAGDVGFDGTNWFVVWTDARNSSATGRDVYGARVSSAGAVLDPTGVPLSTAASDQFLPALAFDGTNWLVAWTDTRAASTTSNDVYGARVSRAGGVLDPSGIAICNATGVQSDADVSFNGAQWLVAWSDQRTGSRYDVYGARVAGAGSVLDPGGLAFSTGLGDKLSVALASNGADWFATWHQNDAPRPNVYGARITAAGVAGTPVPLAASANDTQYFPDVAFDGANWIVVWRNTTVGNAISLNAVRVSAGGSVLDSPSVNLTGTLPYPTSPALGRGVGNEMLLVYERPDPSLGYAERVFGRTLRWAGDPGAACSTGTDCASGYCVDGACCSSACGGGDASDCMACSVAAGAASNGTCGPVAAGRVCRAAAGACDVAEACNGASTACPADGFVASTVECRAAAGACDVAERCGGSSATCPSDTTRADGASCGDGLTCNGAETCAAGVCVAGTSPNCDDGDACTSDSCGEPGGCAHAPIAGCCRSDSDCDDHDACTSDSCVAHACVFAPRSGCAADAGAPDAADVVDVVDVVDVTDAGAPDAADVVDVADATDAPDGSDATDATDAPSDAAVADATDGGVDAGSDVAVADVVVTDVARADASDATASDAPADVARDVARDAVDEGRPPAQGCACRAGGPSRQDSGAVPAVGLSLATALALVARRRARSARNAR